jgi:hypothetical protein
MNPIKKTLPALGALTMLLGLGAAALSCAKDDKKKSNNTPTPEDPNKPTASLTLNLAIANSYGPTTPTLRLADTITPFEATSILSGPPEEMILTIQSMTLEGTDSTGGQRNVTIFNEDAGRNIRIKGSKVDLSQLFEAFDCIGANGSKVTLAEGQTCECGLGQDGTVLQKVERTDPETQQTESVCDLDAQATAPIPLVPVADGTFTKLRVEYAGSAKMKGCVAGYFRESNTKTEPDELYTYCTKTGKSFFDTKVDAKAPEFESTSTVSDLIKVPISRVGREVTDVSAFDTMAVSYDISGGLTIQPQQTADLTMLIDTNRMLRFENGGRTDNPKVFPDWSTDRAYFFNSVFYESAFVFVGKPGTIEGYSWTAISCSPDDRTKANEDDYGCALNQSYQSFLVGGWLTIIRQPDGSPRILSIMPDDDGTLTVIKGSNLRTEQGQMVTDLDYFKTNSDGSTTIKYTLESKVGEITATLPTTVGSKASGQFDGFQNNYGPIEILREL